MESLLQDTNLWLSVSFVIFVFLLIRMGKDGFIKMLDSRIEKIQDDLRVSENLHVEAQELLAQYQRKHRDALQDAEKIIADAKKHAEQMRIDAEQELQNNLDRKEKQLQDRLDRMERNAIAEIQAYATDLAIEATKEIIADKLDQSTNAKLIDQAIDNIDRNIH